MPSRELSWCGSSTTTDFSSRSTGARFTFTETPCCTAISTISRSVRKFASKNPPVKKARRRRRCSSSIASERRHRATVRNGFPRGGSSLVAHHRRGHGLARDLAARHGIHRSRGLQRFHRQPVEEILVSRLPLIVNFRAPGIDVDPAPALFAESHEYRLHTSVERGAQSGGELAGHSIRAAQVVESVAGPVTRRGEKRIDDFEGAVPQLLAAQQLGASF